MKSAKTLVAILGLATLTATSAYAGSDVTVVAHNSETLSKLCETAANGNRAQLHNAIKNTGLSKSFVVENVQCNAVPFREFIASYGKNADSTLDVLPRSTRVSIIDIARNDLTDK